MCYLQLMKFGAGLKGMSSMGSGLSLFSPPMTIHSSFFSFSNTAHCWEAHISRRKSAATEHFVNILCILEGTQISLYPPYFSTHRIHKPLKVNNETNNSAVTNSETICTTNKCVYDSDNTLKQFDKNDHSATLRSITYCTTKITADRLKNAPTLMLKIRWIVAPKSMF